VVGIGLAVFLGLVTGLVPAINAQRVKIVTALGKQ
jgi:putative ABC transport system permease protein